MSYADNPLKKENDRWRDLMVKSQQGDSQAYRLLLKESSVVIHRYLVSRIGDNQVADDILQEALIGIHKARHTFDADRAYIPWMLSLTKYKYVDYLRKWSRTAKHEITDEGVFENLVATYDGFPTNEGLSEELQLALAKLPVKQRQTVELLKIQGLSVKEVASKTGASESAVKVTAHRAYKALRKRLKGLTYEG